MKRLSDFDSRSNSIGFLRLVLALTVLWSHTYDIGGFGFDPITWLTRGSETAGTLAVSAFFVLSGFLVAKSYDRVQSLGRFMWHRFLRVFPAYWVCLAVTAFLIYPIMFFHQHRSLSGVLSVQPSPTGYAIFNVALVMNQVTIGNILMGKPNPYTINGSLWTLPVEFACYCLVGLFAFPGFRFLRRHTVAAATIALYLSFCFIKLSPWHLAIHLVLTFEISVAFLFGCCAHIYSSGIAMTRSMAVTSIALVALTLPLNRTEMLLPLLLAYVVLYAAMNWGPKTFGRDVDLSYGIYIYAFPLQQMLTTFGVNTLGFLPYIAMSGGAVLATAALSWFAIERPCLLLKHARWPFSMATSVEK